MATETLNTTDDRRRDDRAVEEAHALRVVGAVEGRSDPGGARQGHLLLDARRQALHRLQQPADVRQHRPRRRARDPTRSRSRPRCSPTPTRSWRPSRARGSARSSPRSRPATSTSSSSPTAAPRRTRTRSSWRGWRPAATRSSRATARTTARPAGSITLTGDPRRWAAEPGIPGVVHVLDPYHGIERGWDTAAAVAGDARGSDPARRPADDRGVHPRDGHRHQRHPGAARRLHAGRARAVHQARHPDDLRRGDGRLRPHRRVVRGRPLEGRARHHHDGEGADRRVRAARRGRHAARASPTSSTTRCSTAGSPTTAIRWPAPRRWRRSRSTKRTSCSSNAQQDGRGHDAADGGSRRASIRRSAPRDRSACSASSSWCATRRRRCRWRRSTAPRTRWRRSGSSSARKGSTPSCAGTRSSRTRRCASPRTQLREAFAIIDRGLEITDRAVA